ncbi:MAG TPA: GNAT family protein [Candidatus Dojkabacteria bacterium]|nr:GNAT family protein [Candidatus Dojkabacteria bacterium]HRP51092.1 GNAT family protein [Candidatus Dojkabacteria bacterium]
MTSTLILDEQTHEFKTKTGKKALIRYPKWDDLTALTEYINELSKEDTYITVFNQEITLEEEKEFLTRVFKEMESKDGVTLLCFVDDELVAVSGLKRSMLSGNRDDHVAEFGISVKSEYRNAGIGFMLARTVIKEGVANIPGIRIVRLNVFGENEQAIHLYEKLGFEEVGRIPGGILYKESYIDDVLMYLDVSNFIKNSQN